MYSSHQNGPQHHHDYPYDPRTHTFASPAGMHYPALNVSYPLDLDATAGNAYQGPTSMSAYGTDVPDQWGLYNYQAHQYGPGDWMPDPRAGLGISTNAPLDPFAHYQAPPRVPHTSYHPPNPDLAFDLPPIPYRSVTLDSCAAAVLRRPPLPASSRPPIHMSSAGTRTASPLSTRSNQERTGASNGHRSMQSQQPRPQARNGGPPKAPLGGIGGKPWDERSVSSPLPGQKPATPAKLGSGITEDENEPPTFQGNPIVIKPPPSTYSPPDSPELPSAISGEYEADSSVRRPRKERFPWPKRIERGPPETIPLPASPIEPDPEKGGRRTWTSIASTAIIESSEGSDVKGKHEEIVVKVPSELEWLRQRALASRNAVSQDSRDAAAADDVEHVTHDTETRSSPPAVTSDIAKQEIESSVTDPLTRPPSSADDPNLHRSPSSSTRREISAAPHGNSAFIRRQLGGMLRSGPFGKSSTTASSAANNPEGPIKGARVDGRQESSSETLPEGVPEEYVRHREGSGLASDNVERQRAVGTSPLRALSAVSVDADATRGTWSQETEQSLTESLTDAYSRQRQPDISPRSPRSDTPKTDGLSLLPADQERRSGREEEVETANEIASHSEQIATHARKPSNDYHPSPPAKRLRPESKEHIPRSRFASTASTASQTNAPKTRLRPDASAFTPRSISGLTPATFVPLKRNDFTFRPAATTFPSSTPSSIQPTGSHDYTTNGSSTSKVSQPSSLAFPDLFQDRAENSGQSRSGSASSQSETSSPRIDPSTDLHRIAHSPRSQKDGLVDESRRLGLTRSSRGSSETDEGMDDLTPRPASYAGTEEGFATQQARIHGSPAAELHGIFADSPNLPVNHTELFYRPPESEVSDSMEVLSDSFDPVSYSYDTDTESYEISSTPVFFTSTPRGGQAVLPTESPSLQSRHSPTLPTLHVNADHNQDPRERFLLWTFPHPNGHRPAPSIYRRHTFDHLSNHQDLSPESPELGVASTLASRVGDLRAHLSQVQDGRGGHLRVASGPEGMMSTRSSGEFPLRSPERKWAVMNDVTGDGEEGGQGRIADSVGSDAKEEVASKLETQATPYEDIRKQIAGLATRLSGVTEILEAPQLEDKNDLSILSGMIEQQSNLISSLANAVQQSQGHCGDHLVPLLEGQQSVLDRLSVLESGQAEVTDTLASLDERQSDEIVELRSQLDEAIAEKQHQVNRNHQLEVELLGLRQALTTAEDRQKESRAALEVISKRNTSLQLDIRKAQEDKQKLSFELESSEADRGHLASTVEKTQADLETKKGELDAEKSRNVSLSATCQVQASELVGLREATSRLQATLVDRLSRIEEGVQQSTIGSAEYSKLQGCNQKLQEEVNELKEKCHDTELSKQSEHLKLIHLRKELEIVRRELNAECELRRQAEEHAIAAETSERDTIFVSPKTSTKPLHIDSTSVADQHSFDVLNRECQYWQKFALAHDRNAYRNYLKMRDSEGLHGEKSPTSAPAGVGKFTILAQAKGESQTPQAGPTNGKSRNTRTSSKVEDK